MLFYYKLLTSDNFWTKKKYLNYEPKAFDCQTWNPEQFAVRVMTDKTLPCTLAVFKKKKRKRDTNAAAEQTSPPIWQINTNGCTWPRRATMPVCLLGGWSSALTRMQLVQKLHLWPERYIITNCCQAGLQLLGPSAAQFWTIGSALLLRIGLTDYWLQGRFICLFVSLTGR